VTENTKREGSFLADVLEGESVHTFMNRF